MMDANGIIAEIILREGDTYTDNPDDRGGPTKFGITLATLSEYEGHPVTAEAVQALTETTATNVYQELFIRRPGFNLIADPALLGLMVDSGVQHGVERAAKWLQAALGVTPDGVVGANTQAALQTASAPLLYRKVLATRASFYGEIVERDHAQAEWDHGWMNRLAEFILATP